MAAHLPTYCDRALGDRFLLENGWEIRDTSSGRVAVRLVGDMVVDLPPECPCATDEVEEAAA